MSHNKNINLLTVPVVANISVYQHLLQRYLGPLKPQNLLQQSIIYLYPDDPEQPPMVLNPGQDVPLHHPDTLVYPILYQRQKIGELHYACKSQTSKTQLAGLINSIAQKIGLLIKREQASQLATCYLGKTLTLTGYSDSAFTLDLFIEKSANARCPVVIRGEFGSDKLAIASAIHYNSPNKHQPFVEINCALTTTEAFKLKLTSCFKQAPGGCVYFHGIDELSFSQQSLLIELLAANTQHSVSKHPQINTTDIRLLLSTTQSLAKLVEHNTFSRQLYADLNFLHWRIPQLKDRAEDIPQILEKQIQQYRLYPEQDFSEAAKLAFCQYHWPENELELQHTVARLLSLSNNNPIDLDELQQHAPELLINPSPKSDSSVNDNLSLNLISRLMKKDYETLKDLHPGLQKALRYLGDNYCQGITLGELAQSAFVSPSHLSYLLKFTLKRSFKQILAELRIEKAKQIFASTVNSRITDVSLDVGFGDLSHFEKIFKRYTHMTPRQYKNSHRLHPGARS